MILPMTYTNQCNIKYYIISPLIFCFVCMIFCLHVLCLPWMSEESIRSLGLELQLSRHGSGGNQAGVFWMSGQRSCLPSHLSTSAVSADRKLHCIFKNNLSPILTFYHLYFVFYLLQTHHIPGTTVKELTEE